VKKNGVGEEKRMKMKGFFKGKKKKRKEKEKSIQITAN
jgi:hypothetical protein